MADLTEIQSSQSVKIAGADPSTGAESNYLQIDSSGRPTVNSSPAQDISTTGTITTLGGSVTLTGISGYNTHIIQLTGTWVGTVILEISVDGGVTWSERPLRTGIPSTGIYDVVPPQWFVNGVTANGAYRSVNSVGPNQIRVKTSAYTSGTIDVLLIASMSVDKVITGQVETIQHITKSRANSTEVNLDSEEEFVGTAESTLGITAIQITAYADVVLEITIEQSDDGTNWDIADHYHMFADTSDARTFTAVGAFYRIKVKNESLVTSTVMRVYSYMTPSLAIHPRGFSKIVEMEMSDDEELVLPLQGHVGAGGAAIAVSAWVGELSSYAYVGEKWDKCDVMTVGEDNEYLTNHITNDCTWTFVIPSGASHVKVSASIISGTVKVILAANQIQMNHPISGFAATTSYSPDPEQFSAGSFTAPIMDYSGRTETHATVLTDEESWREDFIGSMETDLTGTCIFQTGVSVVNGIGTAFRSEIKNNQMVRFKTDSVDSFVTVASVESDTRLLLESPYVETGGSGTGQVTSWGRRVGTGGSFTWGSGEATVSSGGTIGQITGMARNGDYVPIISIAKIKVSQRIANQEIGFGVSDMYNLTGPRAGFRFMGTDNTKVTCISAVSMTSSAYYTATDVSIPNSGVSSDYHTYELDLTNSAATFSIDGKIVARIIDHLPDPYYVLDAGLLTANYATVSNTDITADYIVFHNDNRVEISNAYFSEPIPTQLFGIDTNTSLPIPLKLDPNGNLIVTALSGYGSDMRFGQVATSSSAASRVNSTTYTEQTSNGQRSIASSSANDAAAGTGARTVQLTYYTSAGVGPKYETITLNGTSRVNTVATDICYIERINVLTVGSGGSNAGTITLYTVPTTGGSAIITIAVGANKTLLCHHYVPSGKTCNITDLSASNDQTSSSSFTIAWITKKNLSLSDPVEIQVSDTIKLYGGSSAIQRTYSSPILVAGPSLLQVWCQPSGNANQNTYASFDYFEP